jgi:hypothetical protein
VGQRSPHVLAPRALVALLTVRIRAGVRLALGHDPQVSTGTHAMAGQLVGRHRQPAVTAHDEFEGVACTCWRVRHDHKRSEHRRVEQLGCGLQGRRRHAGTMSRSWLARGARIACRSNRQWGCRGRGSDEALSPCKRAVQHPGHSEGGGADQGSVPTSHDHPSCRGAAGGRGQGPAMQPARAERRRREEDHRSGLMRPQT